MNLQAQRYFMPVGLVHKSIRIRSDYLGFASEKRTKGSDFSLRFT